MINFERVGTRVRCPVDCAVPNYEDRVFHFHWEAQTEWGAGFLSAEMQKQMRAELERIRRKEYEAGWKDAKAKNTKRKFFDAGWS